MARRVDTDEKLRAKREEFLALVTCGIQVMLQDAYFRPGLDPKGKARVLSQHILNLSIAHSAADKIPDGASALTAAFDVLDHVFSSIHSPETDPDKSWLADFNEGKSRKHRAAWAGFKPHSFWQKLRAESHFVTRRIDGKMRSERPEWNGLPFSDSVALKALSWVRSETKIFQSQLQQQMAEVDAAALHNRLKALEKAGWVKSDHEPDGSVTYEATFKLWDTGSPKTRTARLPKPTFASPTERYHARTRAARVERIAALHKEPSARKVLKAIQRNGPMQLKQIDPLVEGFTRLGLRDFMMDLREGGWVECVGRGGGAAWAATEKLANSTI
ncbi:hypothetical protein [Shinella sumterensis]|uniref:Uncharacterized protein n=1 Tax=Shinella sumterensis TaxID=1967501 RepID=A0AA50H951_9HYPH|nr:hypothetical protein [Shinella sumterensis]WLR98746.1 hypothetical protein Q9313_06915 [Shinella sumterensis]